ncbi:MAG TPA: hypothetical protein VGD10_00550 [Allosphingosinicella sp.]|uniref:hypothetical protein n=1 Tax=Allosphingosinicella sp. TaxID=2823234 RepID=UPI002EDAA28B
MENASTLATRRPDRSFTFSDRMARNLGWFSIGLGLVELVAPGRMARALGLEGRENLLRSYGAREITSGIWALSDTPAPAIWSRVAGDMLDLGTLVVGRKDANEEQRRNATIAIAAVAGIALVDLLTASSLTKEQSQNRGETRDYSDRSGFPSGVAQARGAAEDFEPPADMRVAPERYEAAALELA